MYSDVIVFLVALAVIIPKNILASIKIADDDIHKLLNLIQNQIQDRQDLNTFNNGDADNSNTSDDAELHSGELRKVNVLNRIGQKITANRDAELLNHLLKQKHSHTNPNPGYVKNANRYVYDNSDDTAQVLNKIIRKLIKNDLHSNNKFSKANLPPNHLLGISKDKKNNNFDINRNSLIYLILNPYGLQKSANRNSVLNTLTSKLLSLPSSITHDNQEDRSIQRNKEYSVNENVERRRGSGEMYGPMDSIEDKPKRGRNSMRGAGRTAIPYIRHRGENIYERD